MAEDHIRGKGTPTNYKIGGGFRTPAEAGPFIGIVKNNVDPTRSARLQVYIEQFAGPDQKDPSNWRTVSYLPPFFGSTQIGKQTGTGNFITNRKSYGMWWTPPDIGTKVLCFFVAGDPGNGYYVGCIPEDSLNHTVPALGSSPNFKPTAETSAMLRGVDQAPVVEINENDIGINESDRYFDADKPIHSKETAILFGQGLLKDKQRGTITSSAQRESPSNVFGFSTPGRPIYSNIQGKDADNIRDKVNSGSIKTTEIIGREGGHSIVLDDGDIDGNDNLIRIRTAGGHQITMSDDGEFFHFIHKNGQTWWEMGAEGTIDMFSTNSVNLRTHGTINLHADQDVNIHAGQSLNLYSKKQTIVESDNRLDLNGMNSCNIYSRFSTTMKSDVSLRMQGGLKTSILGGAALFASAGIIGLNSGGTSPVLSNTPIRKNKTSETEFTGTDWQKKFGKLETITTRAPTHEPFAYHNLGVENSVDVSGSGGLGGIIGGFVGKVANKITSTVTKLIPETVLNAASFVQQLPITTSIGNLDSDQLRGLVTMTSMKIPQGTGDFSVDFGIGNFGISPQQLELTGFLKPGTVAKFLQDPGALITDGFGNQVTQLSSVLNNSNVWTGKSGTNVLSDFLSSARTQVFAQEDLYSISLSLLKSKGLVSGNELPAELGALLQATNTVGIDRVADWSNSSINDVIIEQTMRDSIFAIDLVDTKLSGLTKSYGNPGGFANTTERGILDGAMTAIAGNSVRTVVPTGPTMTTIKQTNFS